MSRALLGVTFLTTGALHFLRPRTYEAIMPRYLPAHRELVYASGVAEIAGGAGVLHPRTRKVAIVTKTALVDSKRLAEQLIAIQQLGAELGLEWAEIIPVSAVGDKQVSLV